MKREDALDKTEEMAFAAILKLEKQMEENPSLPVTPGYIKMLKDCHAMLLAGMKHSPFGDDAEPEELLIRIEEVKRRLQRKVAQKQALTNSVLAEHFRDTAAEFGRKKN